MYKATVGETLQRLSSYLVVAEEAADLAEGERLPLGVGLHIAGQDAEAVAADGVVGHVLPVHGLDVFILHAQLPEALLHLEPGVRYNRNKI